MITKLVLLLSLSCPQTIVHNMSGIPWNKEDSVHAKIAEKNCAKKYSEAPCLKLFVKVEPLVYRAICGAEVK